MTSSSRELRRKHKSMQSQVRTLCDERADFLVQLQDQQRDISALRQRLGLAQKENEDLVKVSRISFLFKTLIIYVLLFRRVTSQYRVIRPCTIWMIRTDLDLPRKN